MAHPDALDDCGLPTDADRQITLFHNGPAATMIAICKTASSAGQRLFVRTLSEPRYREILLPFELGFINDAAMCSEMPLLFLNAWQFRSSTRAAADFVRLGRVTLPGAVAEPLPLPSLVETPDWDGPAIPIAVWIERILSVAGTGRALSIVAAIEVPTGETMYSSRAERWLANFDVETGGVTPIARLLADGA